MLDFFKDLGNFFFGNAKRTAATASIVSSAISYSSARKQAKALKSAMPSAIKISAPPTPVRLGTLARTIPRSETVKSRRRRSILGSSGEPQGLLS